MKTIVLAAVLGVAVVASPYAIDEFYNRVIAVDTLGEPLDATFRSCDSPLSRVLPADWNDLRLQFQEGRNAIGSATD